MNASPELLHLFETYTGGPDSLGATLARVTAQAHADDPLIVATSADLVLFPGGGGTPQVQGFRLGTRGFKELAGVSHLGPAIASLLRLRELQGDAGPWRAEAERLLASTRTARAANSVRMWREQIAVAAFRGREEKIAALVNDACLASEDYLERVLRAPQEFTREDLRRRLLEPRLNAVMIATFFLVGMDIAHRVIAWFDGLALDWTRAMALIVGRQGRPTAGVTWTTNSVHAMMTGAARGRLALERIFIAPHGPDFRVSQPPDLAALRAQEQPLRELWAQVRATCELAPLMYEGYPAYAPGAVQRPVLTPDTQAVAEMPAIHAPDDWRALTTRLRVVLEDPRQLLSGCVTDYAVAQLVAHGNDPARVTVPGLDS
ncbi:DUF5624 domain-containing protein [Ramlibacter sp. G-1-2-2]|uniref:DUF5624 domain-containing protein n=1 Tax=Ramlibacter agri TaxID=2728837 RepID=A0A848H659_9BURK|nr:DUF5624 domain-containing protein [Ramlibacter agri]NML45332.1 DUF5624 domain-containing protein [Ramlibacter agri]